MNQSDCCFFCPIGRFWARRSASRKVTSLRNNDVNTFDFRYIFSLSLSLSNKTRNRFYPQLLDSRQAVVTGSFPAPPSPRCALSIVSWLRFVWHSHFKTLVARRVASKFNRSIYPTSLHPTHLPPVITSLRDRRVRLRAT